ncbi:uncharacterized protein [Prorops nasuta]|uniref:uncharacterized protein n=1 Tax=Prorops nasuta TaxID=863751 RepID=UPI0034CEB385
MDEFLTMETANAFRTSLISTIDLCHYLIENFDFKYLLTGKVNQDNLEVYYKIFIYVSCAQCFTYNSTNRKFVFVCIKAVIILNLQKFFGTVRQAAGCNDHPTCPTFLQLYKILSFYSLIKPPKYGNCTIIEKDVPPTLISFHELLSAYKDSNEFLTKKHLTDIKIKLDLILKTEDLEVDDLTKSLNAHDYSLAPLLDCIIYYTTGYLCKKLMTKYDTCAICKNSIIDVDAFSSAITGLVDVKNRGRLLYPNQKFFKLIIYVEKCFIKHASKSDVFESTLEEVLSNYNFTFPCKDHASDIISYCLFYYIRMRMRQFVHQENLKIKKLFAARKKLSKLSTQ